MRLEIDMRLTPDSHGQWLKVSQSTYAIVPEGKGTPFFRYDYVSEATSIPKAHINVHAHRDDLIVALRASGKSQRSKNRRKALIDNGSLPRVSSFHFPVGRTRFRPGIEDILEVAIDEFGLDHQAQYKKALQDGRTRYRERQLAAAVRDSPDLAVDTLRKLGYTVELPASPGTQSSDWLQNTWHYLRAKTYCSACCGSPETIRSWIAFMLQRGSTPIIFSVPAPLHSKSMAASWIRRRPSF